MKRKAIAILLVAALALPAMCAAKGPLGPECLEPYHKLHHEISLRNLVNGLFLTKEQHRKLLALAVKADQTRESIESESKAFVDRSVSAMEQINQALKQGQKPPEDAVAEAQKGKDGMYEIMKKHMKEMEALEAQAQGVLTENQLRIVQTFKPCLVPPRSASNPSAAGAARDGGPLEMALSKLYEADNRRYEKMFDRFFQRHSQRMEEKLGPMDEVEIADEKDRLNRIILKARALDKTQFELEKSRLAEEMGEPFFEIDERREKGMEMAQGRWKLGRVGQWLLDPMLIQILQGK